MSPRRQAWWWSAWCFVVFGFFNSCAGHRDAQTTGDLLSSGAWTPSPGLALSALRAAGTDDGDINRYLAYANAVLGRPYQGYYVRPLEGWKVDASVLATGRDVNDPEATPPVRPDAPLVPYRDFLVEYPPGFFLFAVPPALVALDLDGYRVLFSLGMALLLTAALAACARIARQVAPEVAPSLVPWATGMVLALGTIAVRRYDAVVALSLCALALFCLARRPALAGIAFGIGVAAKGLPLLLAPLPILFWASRRRWRELWIASLAACLVGLLIGLPFARAAGAQMLDLFAYHGQRPLQVESTGGALLILGRWFAPSSATLSQTYGSANVVAGWDGPLRVAAGLLPFAALAGVSAWSWWRMRQAANDRAAAAALLRGLCAALVGLMALGKVFSPQYLTWLLPLGVLVSLLDGRRARVLLLIAFALTQIIYPFAYRFGLANALHPAFGLLVLARNGLLLAWAAWLLRPSAPTEGPAQSRRLQKVTPSTAPSGR
ncbi:MAG: DUF2029 domain-containing protein [Myxococcales bacterium]|nr:DUF2029 domain-containing protein [Myxococcales bacterium]